jgi:hypothetical protein
MEPVGLAVGIAGLAGLFSSCLEAIDRIKDYGSFDIDSRVLDAQLEANRLRFEQWGRSVGLESGQLSPTHHALLDDSRVVQVATELLEVISVLLTEMSPQESKSRPKAFNDKKLGSIVSSSARSTSGASKRQKLTWALGGKKGYSSQIASIGQSIQCLYNLVPRNRSNHDRFTINRANTGPAGVPRPTKQNADLHLIHQEVTALKHSILRKQCLLTYCSFCDRVN